jgi:hypothetical protein
LLRRVQRVLTVEHCGKVASEPLRHAAALSLRRRLERIGNEARKLDVPSVPTDGGGPAFLTQLAEEDDGVDDKERMRWATHSRLNVGTGC